MTTQHTPFVLGTGSCLPRRVMTNADLEEIVETSDEWITTRTGIRSRHIAGPGEETSKLAAEAARRALDQAGMTAAEIDAIILGTISGDMTMPSTACLVQKEIGAVNAFAYDINVACCGFLFGLDLADCYLRRRPGMKILVIGAETLSARTNWEDRNTCVLFGDGAGACVVSGNGGVVASRLFADGRLYELLHMDSARGMNPDLPNHANKGSYIKMAGRDVFRHAVRAMEGAVRAVLDESGVNVDEIALMVPHQANIRILNSVLDRFAIPREKVYVNIHKYGNTSAASIPIALDEAHRSGRIRPGDLVLFCAFGGGFTWGAALVRW